MAQTDSHDVVAGLEAGADDYVTKPFVAKELMARIRTQLRRSAQPEEGDEDLTCGPIELHPDTAEVMRNGEQVPVSRIEFFVLAELIGAKGRVLSRDHLLRKVWGYGNAGDGRVVDNGWRLPSGCSLSSSQRRCRARPTSSPRTTC
jgi:DNA-binding response OmpR family regulator